jgi:beta-aspartyl-dipeptidase (metallo-type)
MRSDKAMFTLIENGDVYAPEQMGKTSVLLCNDRILKVGPIDHKVLKQTKIETEVIDATGCYLVPGFIDPHQHLLGGSGESGFSTQTPEIATSEIVKAGITTVVGCLGVDTTMKTMAGLLAKAKALKEEGLNAYIWSGGYKTPPETITDSITNDIMFIDEVIGAGEIAVSDSRSTAPTEAELARVVHEANNGGMLSNKAGRTHFHIGDCPSRLKPLRDLVENHDISAEWLYPTHISRSKKLMQEAIELAKQGAFVDVDTVDQNLPAVLKQYLENNGWEEKLTVSSDASQSSPVNLYQEIGKCILEHGFPAEMAFSLVTRNTAEALKLGMKGRIADGAAADVLIIEKKTFELRDVFSTGKRLFKNGRVSFKDAFLKESDRDIRLKGQKPSKNSNGDQEKDRARSVQVEKADF